MSDLFVDTFFQANKSIIKKECSKEQATLGGFQDIDEENEDVWIMQCPKGFDINLLENQKVKLPGRTHIGDMESIAVETATSKQAFGYMTRKGRLGVRLLPVSGKIILRHRLPTINGTDATVNDFESSCTPIEVPQPHLRDRHPLLGVNYQNTHTEATNSPRAKLRRIK